MIPHGFDPALQHLNAVPTAFAIGTTQPQVRATGVCHRHRRNGYPNRSTSCVERINRTATCLAMTASRRPPTPAVPSHFEHAGAWRASRHPMRFRAGTIGLASDRRACAPPTDHAGVFFPSCDREADPCDAPSPIARCAPSRLSRREESSCDRSRPPLPPAP
jgi:hypothetical protein